MAENSSFRSAFKGFNREDVISYIAELMERISASEKNAESLQEKLAVMERESNGIRDRYDETVRERDTLAGECARLEQERDEQAKRCAALERKCAELDCLSKSNEEKLGAAMLDAKRFSEMLVQEANERAEAVYQNAYETVATSATETKEIEKQMKEVSDLFEKTMGELRRNMRDLTGRMTAFSEEVKEHGAKFDYRSSFSDTENE